MQLSTPMQRLTAGALAVVAGAGLLLASAAPAAALEPPLAPAGLYGVQDPTYDGAYRQSLALMALAAVGEEDELGVEWLLIQQCPDGGWTSFRADPTSACPATNLSTFTGEDTNSTALAVMALAAQDVPPDQDPFAWLAAAQNDDGGWGYLVGQPTDANSTALVLQALLAAGEDPTSAEWTPTAGANPLTALLALQLGCAAEVADRGAWEYQPGSGPNGIATVQAVPAAAGLPLPFVGDDTAGAEPATLDCTTPPTIDADLAADLGAGWLTRQLTAEGFIAGPGGAANLSLTTAALLALTASGPGNAEAIDDVLDYLAAHVEAAVVGDGAADLPGALALLALAVVSAGEDPTDFGGVDLVSRLTATQRLGAPAPPVTPSVSQAPTSTAPSTGSAPPMPGVAPTLVETGSFGRKPWDALGVTVFGLGLVGYGVLFIAGARVADRKRAHQS